MTAAKNAIVKAAFELKSSHVCEKRIKVLDETFHVHVKLDGVVAEAVVNNNLRGMRGNLK